MVLEADAADPDDDPVSPVFDPGQRHAFVDMDAFGAQPAAHHFDQFGVVVAEQGGHLEQGDTRSETAVGLGELDADGFLTQATNEDSDGDGVGDASDGSPLDASTSDPGERPDEPEVAVSQTSVALTSANRSVELIVSNAGAGELQWVAIAANDALVTVTLSGASGGRLTIALAPGFEPGTSRLETSVRVFDATGAFQDLVRVTVILGG